MRAARALLCAALAVAPALASAGFDPAAMRLKYVAGASASDTMGWTGVDVRDVDGVAGDEILIGYTSMWQVLRWDRKAAMFVQGGFVEYSEGDVFGRGDPLLNVHLADLDHRGKPEVVVLTVGGALARYEPDGTLRSAGWTPALHGSLAGMLLGDVDGQPGDELVFETCSEITAWKYGASAPLWRIPIASCQSLLLAQLDRDPQLELVLGSGTVIDTKTLQTQWRYPLGFGTTLLAADVDGDGLQELIGCHARQCDAFSIERQTTLWETFLPYPYGVGALTAADVDGDGKAELFEGDDQHGYVRKLDGLTGTIVQQFQKQGGANFVAVADLAGDCNKELVWAKDGDSTAPDTLHVTDAVTMKPLWDGAPEQNGSSGVLVADFAGTGHPSILWPSRASSVERFVSFNPPSRSTRELSGSYSVFATYLPVSAAAQLDGDAAVEYVLPLVEQTTLAPTAIGVYDGATHQLQWSLPLIASGDALSAMTAGDLTGDGVPDIVVASSIEYVPRSHNEAIVAVDGATHKVLWRTNEQLSHYLDTIPADCLGCVVEVKIADLDRNGSKQVLALVPKEGLFAFDGSGGAPLWHRLLGGPDDAAASKAFAFTVADLDPSPGAEIVAALADDRLAVFDSTGGKLLRAKDLSAFGHGLAVEVADLDGDGAAEIALVSEAGLLVLSAGKLDVLWSGGFALPFFSRGNQIAIADVDGDGTPEIVVASAHALRVFEYRPNTPDTAPPSFANAAIRPAAASGCCRIAFEWNAAADSQSMPVKYRIYRSLAAGFNPDASSRIAETAATEFADRAISQARTYYYAVTAVDAAGNESPDPLRLSATAPPQCPGRPHAARGQ